MSLVLGRSGRPQRAFAAMRDMKTRVSTQAHIQVHTPNPAAPLRAAVLAVVVAVAGAVTLAAAVPAMAQSGTDAAQLSTPVAVQAVSDAAAAATTATTVAPVALKPDPEFARYPRYVGTLGAQRVELLLGPKSDDPGELHGEYHMLDTGSVVLVAGERDGDVLQLEESNDGTHITGQWVGRYGADGVIEGDRMNDDESEQLSFTLHPAAYAAAP